MTTNY